jgi:hypothetical protein
MKSKFVSATSSVCAKEIFEKININIPPIIKIIPSAFIEVLFHVEA